jgi:hypothetical protein
MHTSRDIRRAMHSHAVDAHAHTPRPPACPRRGEYWKKDKQRGICQNLTKKPT